MMNIKKTTKNCMKCNNIYSRGMLVTIFGMSYIQNIYKDHIIELLFNEEKIYIPMSMIVVERNKEIKNVKKKYLLLSDSYKSDLNTFDKIKLQYEMKACNAYIKYLKNKPDEKEKRNEYKYPCASIDCNGFVNNQWKCEICDKITCKNCFKIKDINHECIKDDIDTAEIIKKDCKPCPKCNISIMKSSGCDQMWCASCHTSFDWKTLKIITKGIIHNPEYFRYMRENEITIERNPNDNPCINELYNSYIKLQMINSKKKLTKILSPVLHTQLYDLYRKIQHCDNVVIRDLNNKINDYEEWKNNERVRFLEKIISEKQYKCSLFKKFKDIEYIKEIIILQKTIYEISKETYIKVIDNIIDNIDINLKNKVIIYEIDELKNLLAFNNKIYGDELKNIRKNYNRTHWCLVFIHNIN